MPVRTPVEELHDGPRTVAEAAGGRTAAARALRRKVPGLSPAHALAHVTGLLAGEVPAPLLAVARQELVDPFEPAPAVHAHGVDGGR
ncbi:hypothetical protein [Streptomyces omiyaensis]|uniref:Uncharacterized protein n=1 Tax=Streptomyces omiyaensis TaxID=68247 RepID=A0ABW7C5P8_9ACTN|nr:hypothetical protein [Streptomyces omiyaensis]